MNTEMAPGTNCSVRQFTPDECTEYVQELANLLVPAFERAAGEIDVWSALRECALGKMQCFIGDVNGLINAAMITAFTDYPLKRVCDVVAYAGKAKHFYAFGPILEQWARDNGACEMRGYGSPATERLACQLHGYKPAYHVYIKPL